MTDVQILLDEHVGRVFERLLGERGYTVVQAKDQFGEHTSDAALLTWCGESRTVLVTNNAKDFEPLHHEHDHAGIFLYYDQKLPDTDPEGLLEPSMRCSHSTEWTVSRTSLSISGSGTTGSISDPRPVLLRIRAVPSDTTRLASR